MKVQFDADAIRVRLAEADLAVLLGGGALGLSPLVHGGPLFTLRVELGARLAFEAGDDWRLTLPRDAVEVHAATLPNRHGLAFDLGDAAHPLRLLVDVDVRDSVATRGPTRRA